MTESQKIEIAEEIVDKLHWINNPKPFASATLGLKKKTHFYKISNSDRQKDGLGTFADYLVSSVEDAVDVIYIVNKAELSKEDIKSDMIIDIGDNNKPLFMLLKLKE